MDIPIEVFALFIGSSIALGIFGFLRNPQIPAMLAFAGIFILVIAVSTTNIDFGSRILGTSDPSLTNTTEVLFASGTLNNEVSLRSGANVAIAEEMGVSSFWDGYDVTSIYLQMRKNGSPTGNADVGICDASVNMVRQIGTVNVATLTASFVEQQFNVAPEYELLAGSSYICVKYSGGSLNNELRVRTSTVSAYDGTNTRYVQSTTGTSWSAQAWDIEIRLFGTLPTDTDISYRYERDLYEFTELPKVLFALLGAVFMLTGALMVGVNRE